MDKASVEGAGSLRRGGKKAAGIRRVTFNVSCQPEERDELRRLAKEAGKTVSAFLLDAALPSRKGMATQSPRFAD